MMRTPRPRQALKHLLLILCVPSKADKTYHTPQCTHPLHALQSTFLLSCSLVVFPLYRSSKDTLGKKEPDIYFSGCIISSPLLLPFRLLL
uniref:Secreted protein n=1 Tax=Nannospalax galili TaxID=1026970 RepID=A0A8C6RT69_NANGA